MDYRKVYKTLPSDTKDYLDQKRNVFYTKIIKLIEESSLFYKTPGYFGSWTYTSKEKTISNYHSSINEMRKEPYIRPRIEIKSDRYLRKPVFNEFGKQTHVDNDYKNPLFDIKIWTAWRVKHIITEKKWIISIQKEVFSSEGFCFGLIEDIGSNKDFVRLIEEKSKGEINFSEAEKKLFSNIDKSINETMSELIQIKEEKDKEYERFKLKKQQNFQQKKNNVFQEFDKDNNGTIDIIEGDDDFMKLFQKHQDAITKLDKTYVHNFVKLSNYLGKKRDNIQTIFASIKKVNNESQLSEQVGILKNQIHTYKSLLFHSLTMVISVVENDLITFYQIYETLDKLNIFNSNWENELSQKISDVNSNLESVNANLRQVSQGLLGVMYSIQKMELSILDEMNNLTYVTQEGFSNLENSLSRELQSIDSSLRANNLLSGIQAYQLYKINKQTKGLSN